MYFVYKLKCMKLLVFSLFKKIGGINQLKNIKEEFF